jgi:transposase-like protein
LDEQVRVFLQRPLEGRYPYLWLDAKVERVREPSGVRHKALVIAYGVHEIRGIFQATSLAEARERLVEVVDKLQTAAPKVARLLNASWEFMLHG